MSEKRFKVTDYGSNYYIEIIDNEKKLDESIHNPSQKLGLVDCCDLLNELFEHNLHLQKLIETLAKVSGEPIEDMIERYTNNKEIYTTSERPMRFIPNKKSGRWLGK